MHSKSALVLPVIFLLVLPFITLTLHYLLGMDFSRRLATMFSYVSVAYGVYPALYSIKRYSRRRGNENIVIELRFIETLFIILASLLAFFFTFLFILPIFTVEPFSTLDKVVGHSNLIAIMYILGTFTGSLSLVVIGVFFRIVTQVGKKEFRFYFAKGCCKIMSRKGDDIENMKYLYLLLDSYNKYLRRNLKFGVKDINKIFSLIMYSDEEEKNRIIKSICDSLENNRMKLARFLSTIYKVPESDLFVKESLFQQLKVVGGFLAAAIPIVISIIQQFLPKP